MNLRLIQNILLAVFLTLANSQVEAQNTEVKVVFLDTISAKGTSILLCSEKHHHPVDIKAKLILDSLKAKGIDTILLYRDWIGINGFNGYGKVLWLDQGITKKYQINYINDYPYVGIKSIVYSVLRDDTVFNFIFKNRVDIFTSLPTKQKRLMSHDSDHFVYLQIADRSYCYHLSGLLIEANPGYLSSKLIEMLRIDASQYINKFYRM